MGENNRVRRGKRTGRDGPATVRIDRDELERIVDERVAARLEEEEDRPARKLSRRGLLGLAGGVAGFGALSSTASGETNGDPGARGAEPRSPGIARADEVQAESIHAGSTLTVDGEPITASAQPTKPSDGLSDVIHAGKANEIQDAIDTLAEGKDGHATGGVVQLDAKTYYPTTTIWLKRGVTLQGVRPAGHQPNPYGERFTSGTVISTRDLPEGKGNIDPSKGTNTYSHSNPDGRNWHPHLPVVANFRTKPYFLQNRGPTDYEADHWGHNIGLKNVVIDGSDKQRWWDDGSSDATYFGVYDGVLFEHSRNVTMEHVTTRKLLGYGGFFNGCRGLVDRGSTWSGGATDYHGSALVTNVGYPPDPTVYTAGVWDVDVRGPPPVLKLNGHSLHRFESGGWSQTSIKATERSNHDWQFLGSEDDYWSGNAPLTEPKDGRAAVVHGNCVASIDGYTVDVSNPTKCDGILVEDSSMTLQDVSVSGGRRAIHHAGRNTFEILNCSVSKCDVGLRCRPNAPRINGLKIADCREGINFGGRSNYDSVMDDVLFHSGVDVAFGAANNRPIYMGTVYFGGADRAGKTGEYLMIDHPIDPNGIY